MKKYNIIFIHPPINYGSIHTTNAHTRRGNYIFIPMGVFAIADLLEREGFSVKIINFPLEKFLNPEWNLTNFLKDLEFDICAIDLHWIHNSYGAIYVSKVVKKINKNVKVILGGYSASYYHTQILQYYRTIDGIIRGDGEIPFLEYARCNAKKEEFDSVPNLTYRDSSGKIKINPLSYSAKSLENLNFSNLSLMHNAEEYLKNSRKIMGISYNVSIGRGCPFNCPFCAGGREAQERMSCRKEVILRSPQKVVEDIVYIYNNYKIDNFFFGHGTYPETFNYWEKLFSIIRKENINISADIEIWRLPFPKKMFQSFHKTFDNKKSSLSISPRTTSFSAQQKIAKLNDPTFIFKKSQIYKLIDNANLFQIPLRIWLTIGFPFQNRREIIKDLLFAMECMVKYGKSKKSPISIMSEPYFIFPGSPVFQNPEKYGIRLKLTSFPEIVNAFKHSKISFFYNLTNYDNEYFSGNLIRKLNILFFLIVAPMFLTTSS